MNEMYSMSIVAHNYGVMMLFSVIFINFYMLIFANDIKKYKRILSLYNPIAFTAMGSVAFTGVIMMAAKHLDFTIENIAMITLVFVYVVLEVKRLKTLKTLKEKSDTFIAMSKKIFIIEFVLVLAMSIWMNML